MQRKFYTKLVFLILVILACGVVNSIIGLLTNITLAFFLLLVFVVVYLFYKIPKKNMEYSQMTSNIMIMFAVSCVILTYSSGLFLGFESNPSALNAKNIITVVIIIIFEELIRYVLVDKAQRKWYIVSLIGMTFVVLDLTLKIPTVKYSDLSEVLKFVFVFLLPSISSNILLTYSSKRGNLKGNIAYRLITMLPVYLIPVSPNLGLYMTGVTGILMPIILTFLVARINRVERDEVIEPRDQIFVNIITGIATVFMIALILVFSGWFKYRALVIASSSMAPDIIAGDVVIIENLNEVEQESLSDGDILVFKKESVTVVHRITNITNLANDAREYTTKGDANNDNDSFKTLTENVIGREIFKIPYIGWPTIWLNEKITS